MDDWPRGAVIAAASGPCWDRRDRSPRRRRWVGSSSGSA